MTHEFLSSLCLICAVPHENWTKSSIYWGIFRNLWNFWNEIRQKKEKNAKIPPVNRTFSHDFGGISPISPISPISLYVMSRCYVSVSFSAAVSQCLGVAVPRCRSAKDRARFSCSASMPGDAITRSAQAPCGSRLTAALFLKG